MSAASSVRNDDVGSKRVAEISRGAGMPGTTSELREWVRDRLHLPHADEIDLLAACEAMVTVQRDIWMEKAHCDPKTALLNFTRFMEQLAWFLGFEQQQRCCSVGLVDITNFKWYNDTLGHLAGDRIIERVARILAEQIRSDDLLAGERQSPGCHRRKDLHARFGGDEFCFMISNVPGRSEACRIAQRFKTAVERYRWVEEDPALAERPVSVDVGVVCLQLGPFPEPQLRSETLAAELVRRADELMYRAKGERATGVRSSFVRLDDGELVEMISSEDVPSRAIRTACRTMRRAVAASLVRAGKRTRYRVAVGAREADVFARHAS